MRVGSINIGMPRTVDMGAGPESTAIFKTSVDGPIAVTEDGLAGNAVGDTEHHGGPDQALYLYFGADYAHWERLLDRPLEPGVFGDNLTIEGTSERSSTVSSNELWVGDQVTVGPVTLEVTAPRIPCGTFSRRMELPASFIEHFRTELRPGVYARVLEPGEVTVGDHVTLIEGPRTVSIVEMVELWGTRPDIETIDRLLAAPIAERDRADFERKRAKL
jgi:MOSC domain-containing protein YiiM